MYVCMYVYITYVTTIHTVCMHVHTYKHLVIQCLVYCIHCIAHIRMLNLQEMLIDFDKNSDDMVSLEEYVGKCGECVWVSGVGE